VSKLTRHINQRKIVRIRNSKSRFVSRWAYENSEVFTRSEATRLLNGNLPRRWLAAEAQVMISHVAWFSFLRGKIRYQFYGPLLPKNHLKIGLVKLVKSKSRWCLAIYLRLCSHLLGLGRFLSFLIFHTTLEFLWRGISPFKVATCTQNSTNTE
jgi:hypothetical protein